MIPGRFHAETQAPFKFGPDTWTAVPLVDDEGRPATTFYLPIGDTVFNIQYSDTGVGEPMPVKIRPNRFLSTLVRLNGGDEDTTGKANFAIHAPTVWIDSTGKAQKGVLGTSTWQQTHTIIEYVNVNDGLFQLRVNHNGGIGSEVDCGKVVVKANNDDAKTIYRLGGFSMYSDGKIR